MRRITPAYAGNTEIKISAIGDIKDHPRLRGEHFDYINAPYDKTGITPAYAGNTA